MLHRFNFAVFSKGPPATNRESPEGRGEGSEGFCLPLSGLFLRARPRALPFPSSDFSEKHSSQTRGEKNVRSSRFSLPLAASGSSRKAMRRRSAVWWTRAAPAQAARRVTSNFCEHFPILTYNGEDKPLGGVTYGGYSESIVVDEGFVLKVSENLNLAAVAPLLCAGITTYSPLRHWKVSKGQKVGIVVRDGLGHMGVKFANAFGAHVVLFTTSRRRTRCGWARKAGSH
jgi:hypothetical protein